MRHDDDNEHKYVKSHVVEVKYEGNDGEHGESVEEVRKSHGEDS